MTEDSNKRGTQGPLKGNKQAEEICDHFFGDPYIMGGQETLMQCHKCGWVEQIE